ncbi:hypothetical protein O4H52_00925 [Sphingomonadaceae bacterium G21617-S1]|nr:hypothetical protein [Sphingomonadaceae bacterium G21617-S1]
MRLYRTPGGRWIGTQADAGNACLDEGRQRTAWAEIDVPTDKPRLLVWLNDNAGPASVEASRAEAELDRLRENEARRAESEIDRAGGERITVMAGSLPSIASDDDQIWRRMKVIPAPARDMSASAHLSRMENPGVDIDRMIETIAGADMHSLKRFAGAVAVRFSELAK